MDVSTKKAADNNKPSAMEVESGGKLPDYTDTEILMDDMGLSLVDFMSRFENFKVDEISIDDAEADICFNAKEHFEESPMMSLIGLRFTEDESTIEWEKRKVEYSPAGHLPKDFQELLKSDCGNNCSFPFALHPENINKEILTVIGSAHIFVDKKSLKQKLFSALQKWFYNPEAFKKQAESKTNEPKKARKIEPGFIDKLLEMLKYRQILKQEIKQSDGLSSRYIRTEGSYIVVQMLTFYSTYMNSLFENRIQNLDANFQQTINKARFENYFVAYNALRCICEAEYDIFMNVSLWESILEEFCDRTHSQFGIVAIIRAATVIMNKLSGKVFWKFEQLMCRSKQSNAKTES